jgi:hypothetical protein
MKKILTCLTVVGCLAVLIMAQRAPAASTAASTSPATPQPPDIVVNGYKEFKTGGYVAATNAWAKDSSLLLDTQTLQGLNNYFSTISANSGSFQGADVVRLVPLSADTQMVYTVAKFERQLIYISFTCYKTNDKWIITWIVANKDPAVVLPTMIMSGN